MRQRYQNYQSYQDGYYQEPKSFWSGGLTLAILLGFGAIVVIAAMALISGRRQAPVTIDMSGIGPAINAQIVGATNPSTGVALTFPAVWQRDKGQYASEAEWREWSASACSAAALTSVLNGYGKVVKVTDVLGMMREQGSISSSGGLFRYGVFGTIATKYGLKAEYSESKDLNSHFDSIMAGLAKGYPVIINVQDNTYFPNGHFIVAVKASADNNTVSVINPDPTRGKQVLQEWQRDDLKTYFSRSLRSAIYKSA